MAGLASGIEAVEVACFASSVTCGQDEEEATMAAVGGGRARPTQ